MLRKQAIVMATCLIMFMALFAAISAATPAAEPAKPVDLLAAPLNKKVDLSWSPPKGGSTIVAYNVYVDGEFYKKVNGLETTVTKLENGNQYLFAVSAVDVSGIESAKTSVRETPTNVLPYLLLIFICIAYIYNKVFRVEQLTIRQSIQKHMRALRNRQFKVAGRSLLIYFLILCGSYMLLFFELMGLPILISLAVAIGLMVIVRIRYWLQGRQSGTGASQ